MIMQSQHNRNRSGSKKSGTSYKTTSNGKELGKIVLLEIALEMYNKKLPEIFVINAIRAAFDYDGIADLMKLWNDEEDQTERSEIIADIQDMLDASAQQGIVE